jgi:hypothetical protein
MGTEWAQKQVTLSSKPRGCHVVTKEVYKHVPEIHDFDVGLANIWSAFLQLLLTNCNQNTVDADSIGAVHITEALLCSHAYERISDNQRECLT